MAANSRDHIIAVMGATGAGKSTFIRLVTGRDDVVVGDRLVSETNKVTSYNLSIESEQIILVDTPGFDDTYISDRDVLRTLSSWLESSYRDGRILSGILYLHRICDARMQGSTLRNLYMFKKLCGSKAMRNIVLGTTFWDTMTADPTVGNKREQGMIEDDQLWGEMVKQGSTVVRIPYTKETAAKILLQMISRNAQPLQLQHELVDQKKFLDETAASKVIAEPTTLVEEHEERVNAVGAKHDARIRRLVDEHRHKRNILEDKYHERLCSEETERVRVAQEFENTKRQMLKQLEQLQVQNEQLSRRIPHQDMAVLPRSAPLSDTFQQIRRDVSSAKRGNSLCHKIEQEMETSAKQILSEQQRGMLVFSLNPIRRASTRFCHECSKSIGSGRYYGK
ncbi:hypothetical protein LTR05_008795 [Lithohypha guttulata]|uniref:G domain-containing protein n=1 Tax=Lithohypha guttulata TaxID=1690604 RepID=A0AAN7PJN7_9EURO|nr:hypothetical protein LTR05_008795 [Lithohypha guttulata]